MHLEKQRYQKGSTIRILYWIFVSVSSGIILLFFLYGFFFGIPAFLDAQARAKYYAASRSIGEVIPAIMKYQKEKGVFPISQNAFDITDVLNIQPPSYKNEPVKILYRSDGERFVIAYDGSIEHYNVSDSFFSEDIPLKHNVIVDLYDPTNGSSSPSCMIIYGDAQERNEENSFDNLTGSIKREIRDKYHAGAKAGGQVK